MVARVHLVHIVQQLVDMGQTVMPIIQADTVELVLVEILIYTVVLELGIITVLAKDRQVKVARHIGAVVIVVIEVATHRLLDQAPLVQELLVVILMGYTLERLVCRV